LAAGCATKPPYSLTGTNQQQVAQNHENWRQQMAYTDDKGHYRADLAAKGQPARYIPD
jgi:hypothetical protein